MKLKTFLNKNVTFYSPNYCVVFRQGFAGQRYIVGHQNFQKCPAGRIFDTYMVLRLGNDAGVLNTAGRVKPVWNLEVVDPGAKISIFPRKFPRKKIIFFRLFHKKFLLSRQKLAIYSYFWPDYSISLQKSPLSNMLPVHYKIIIIYITTACDL